MATIQARHLNSDHIASVSEDNRLTGKIALQKLIELGHRDIALLGYFSKAADSTGQGLHGAVDAMKAAGLQYDPALYAEVDFTLLSAYEGICRLLKKGIRFTAIFAARDIMVIGAIKALHRHGLSMPGDVSVIGFDGIQMRQYLIPTLTSIRQPTVEIPQESVRRMSELIAGSKTSHVLLDCELMPGESVCELKHTT